MSLMGDDFNKSVSSAFVADVQNRLVAIHELLCTFIIKLLDYDENQLLLQPYQKRFVSEFNKLY